LVPCTHQGRFNISVVYEGSADGIGRTRGNIVLGPFRITTLNQERLHRFATRTSNVLRDLTWPIVLAFLGYWFQRKQSERDSQIKRATEEREHRQQIWNSILPRFHELAERHYLPIVRSLRLVTEKWSNDPAWLNNDTSIREYLFELLLFVRKMQFMREEKGQFFFSSRTVEPQNAS
jgi:hypothetical protein